MVVAVTDEIISALLKLKLSHGSNEELGRILGITKKHVGQILSGNVEYIQEHTWNNMYPHLKHLLPHNSINRIMPPTSNMDSFDRLAKWMRECASSDAIDAILTTAHLAGYRK